MDKPTYEQLEAALRYLDVVASQFPHVNVDAEGVLGAPDAEDVYCLGCTIQATTQELNLNLQRDEDGDIDGEAAMQALAQWDVTLEEIEAESRLKE